MYLQQHKPAVSLFCTAAVSKGQLCFAKSTLALHWCWTTAHLCQEQISIGVFAATQACCQPVLHSSSEQGATVLCQKRHWCWATAHLWEEQISIGVFAATQACCQPVLHSSSEQGATVLCQKHSSTALVLDHCTPVSRANLHRCICSNTSLLSACFAQQQ